MYCYVYCFRALVDLRACYEDVFTIGCGQEGGGVIGGLMTKAFQDPFYLRYKYIPDCDLHGITLPPATESTYSKKHHDRVTTIKPRLKNSKTKQTHPKNEKENKVLDSKSASYKSSSSSLRTQMLLQGFWTVPVLLYTWKLCIHDR